MARIGIDARMYGPQQTGIGTYIEYLVKNLAVLDKKNEYILFLLEPAFSNYQLPMTNYQKIRVSAHWYSLAEQTKFYRALQKARCDLVHFPHFNLPLLYNWPFVVTIHDLTPKFFPGHKVGKNPLRRWAYNAVLNHAVKKARHIITPSRFTKDDVVKYLGASPEKISVIYEGVKDKRSPKQQASLLKNFEAAKQKAFEILVKKFGHRRLKKPFIFYVGVWRNHKNITGLIKAFNILVNEYKLDYQLVLGGKEDPHYPEVRRTWEMLGLGERVYAPGMIFGEELNMFYRAARLFCLPSFYEGFGLVAVEAVNQGTAVAASKFGPVPEVVGNASRYFDPRDPADMAHVMAEILHSPAQQKALVAQGQKRISRYDWAKMAKETLAVYQAALKRQI